MLQQLVTLMAFTANVVFIKQQMAAQHGKEYYTPMIQAVVQSW